MTSIISGGTSFVRGQMNVGKDIYCNEEMKFYFFKDALVQQVI